MNQHSESTWLARLRDRILLLGAAFAVCIVGCGAFLLGDVYHVNAAWVFFAWNSILLYFIVVPDFRGHLKNWRFLACVIAWMVLHGLFVLFLMRRVPVSFWLPLIAVELAIGYVVLGLSFGGSRTQRE